MWFWNLARILVLVLVPMVWGWDCVSEDVQIWKFPVGDNAIISVKGDTDQGCKFELQNDETKSCCYMNKTRQDKPGYNMCLNHQSETCINETRFTVDDFDPRGQCILRLTNFEASDAGQYNVKFPSESRNNKIKRIDIRKKKPEIIKRIDIGHSETIVVEGDIKAGEGCKFVATLELDSKVCCHESNNTSHICTEKEASKGCTKYKVTIDGNKCVIHLENFQASDTGKYEAIFPSDPKDNEVVHVIVYVESIMNNTWLTVLFTIPTVIVIGIALYFCLKKVRKSEIVNRSWITDQITKDKAIFDALQLENREEFTKKLGNKCILKVSDHYQNNIFHIAADEQWTTEMNDIVVSQCKEIFPTKRNEVPTGDAELESMTGKYIFSAKVPKPYEWFPKWFPRRLLPNHIDINTQNLENMTPLHIAVGKNLESAVMSLLKNGADPNIKDKDGYTALQKAILFQHCKDTKDPDNIQTVRTLLGQNQNLGSSIKAKLTATSEGQNPLHSAVLKNNLTVIKLIIKEQEEGLYIPLQEVQNENEIPQNLLNQKWKQKKNNLVFSETPIELAVRLGYTNIVRFILDACDKSWRQVEGHHVMQLISRAAAGGHSKIVDLLLIDKYGEVFDPEYKIKGDTCLQIAIKDGNPVAVNIILGKMLDRIFDVEQAEPLVQDLLKQEETKISRLNIYNETEAQIKSRQMSTKKKDEEDNKKDRQILEGFKRVENLKRINFALKRHFKKDEGQDVKIKTEQEHEKVKLSEETIHEQLRHIYASNNTLSRGQIIQILKIMSDTHHKQTL